MYAANSKTGHQSDSADDSLAMVAKVMSMSCDSEHEALIDTLIATSISEHKSNSALSTVLRDVRMMRMLSLVRAFPGVIEEELLTVRCLHSWQALLSGVRCVPGYVSLLRR